VGAHEQGGADGTLEIADAMADRRGREMQRRGRGLEALQADHRIEGLQGQQQRRLELGRGRRRLDGTQQAWRRGGTGSHREL
jgi:hypothetical protein